MKKLLLAILIVMSIVLAQVAFAGTFSDAAEAWFQKTCVTGKRAPTGINAAVCDLRERVLTLEATQPPAPSLSVVDNNNLDRGHFLRMVNAPTQNAVSDENVEVFDNTLGLSLLYDLPSGNARIPGPTGLERTYQLFQSGDCAGDSFVENVQTPYHLITIGPGGQIHYYKADGYQDAVQNLNYNSIKHGITATSTCEVISGTAAAALRVHEISIPSGAGPLRIVED